MEKVNEITTKKNLLKSNSGRLLISLEKILIPLITSILFLLRIDEYAGVDPEDKDEYKAEKTIFFVPEIACWLPHN